MPDSSSSGKPGLLRRLWGSSPEKTKTVRLPVHAYGKLPIYKDFISSGMTDAPAQEFRAWLDKGFSHRWSSDDECRDTEIPPHSFLLRMPVSKGYAAGSLWGSSDEGGLRKFPFALFFSFPKDHGASDPLAAVEYLGEVERRASELRFLFGPGSSLTSFYHTYRGAELELALHAREQIAREFRSELSAFSVGEFAESLFGDEATTRWASLLAAASSGADDPGAVRLPLGGRLPRAREIEFWLFWLSRQDPKGRRPVTGVLYPHGHNPGRAIFFFRDIRPEDFLLLHPTRADLPQVHEPLGRSTPWMPPHAGSRPTPPVPHATVIRTDTLVASASAPPTRESSASSASISSRASGASSAVSASTAFPTASVQTASPAAAEGAVRPASTASGAAEFRSEGAIGPGSAIPGEGEERPARAEGRVDGEVPIGPGVPVSLAPPPAPGPAEEPATAGPLSPPLPPKLVAGSSAMSTAPETSPNSAALGNLLPEEASNEESPFPEADMLPEQTGGARLSQILTMDRVPGGPAGEVAPPATPATAEGPEDRQPELFREPLGSDPSRLPMPAASWEGQAAAPGQEVGAPGAGKGPGPGLMDGEREGKREVEVEAVSVPAASAAPSAPADPSSAIPVEPTRPPAAATPDPAPLVLPAEAQAPAAPAVVRPPVPPPPGWDRSLAGLLDA